jgi:DNA-binding MarR family transcriptional regulator
LSKFSPLPETDARRRPENLAILLRELFLAMNEALIGRLAERGHPEVRYAHGNVFAFLEDAGTRVSVLADRAQITKQAMAQLVAHLEQHWYVERVADPSDRRAKLVRSTARGRAVFSVVRDFVAEVDAHLVACLGETKLEQLRGLLQELGDAVDGDRAMLPR